MSEVLILVKVDLVEVKFEFLVTFHVQSAVHGECKVLQMLLICISAYHHLFRGDFNKIDNLLLTLATFLS